MMLNTHYQGEDGSPVALLQTRLLNNALVGRAALFDHDDFLCVASSKQRFDIDPDGVRKAGVSLFAPLDDLAHT